MTRHMLPASHCPTCQVRSGVKDSRPSASGYLRRRRVCNRCGTRWTTYEIAEGDFEKVEAALRMLHQIEKMGANAKAIREAAE